MALSVYLIFGDEYLVAEKAKEIIDTLVPREDRALGQEVIDGRVDSVDAALTALNYCIEAIQTIGLLGNRKVVWFRDVNFLIDNVVGKSEAVKTRVKELGAVIKAGLLPGQILIMTSPKIDKRQIFYKACKEAGKVHEFAVPDKPYLVERQAEQMAGEVFKKAGLKVSGDALQMFQERVGTDTRQIVNEIEKLDVFLGQRRDVRLSDIEAVTCSSRNLLAWDLADAFGKRDMIRALEILRQLIFQKESPIYLIVTLEGRIRDLMIYREAMDKGWIRVEKGRDDRSRNVEWRKLPPEVETMFSKEFEKDPRHTHPYRAGLLAAQAELYSSQDLEECRRAVLDAHEKLVSSSIPEAMILEILLIKMLG